MALMLLIEHLNTSFCLDKCFHFSWPTSLFGNTLFLCPLWYHSLILSLCLLLALLSNFIVISSDIMCQRSSHPNLRSPITLKQFHLGFNYLLYAVKSDLYVHPRISKRIYIYMTVYLISPHWPSLRFLKINMSRSFMILYYIKLVLSHFSPSYKI